MGGWYTAGMRIAELYAEGAAQGRPVLSFEFFPPKTDAGYTALYRNMNETIYQRIREATDPLLERSYPLFH